MLVSVKLENFFSNCFTNGSCTTQPVFKGSITTFTFSSPKKDLVIGIGEEESHYYFLSNGINSRIRLLITPSNGVNQPLF